MYKEIVKADPKNACRVTPIGMGEKEPSKYIDENGKEQVLTDEYINQFKADKSKFEALSLNVNPIISLFAIQVTVSFDIKRSSKSQNLLLELIFFTKFNFESYIIWNCN